MKDAEFLLKRLTSSERRLDELIADAGGAGMRKDEAARMLYSMNEEGAISIVEPLPPHSLVQYLRSPRGAWVLGVGLFVLLTLSAVYILPSSTPIVYIRYMAGSAFILYLPGYSLVEALYSKADELDSLERLALSMGLSLAVVPLVGLVLNYTPWGVRMDPIVVSLSLLTLLLVIVSAQRKLQLLRRVNGV
jgi:hypothetical protein